MDYIHIYDDLIKSRQQQTTYSEYHEIHHIIPRSEGGTDDKSNLVNLTAREHYIAHLLLAKIYSDSKMYSAIMFMQTSRHKHRKFKFNSYLYAAFREHFRQTQLGKKVSATTRRKQSKAHKGKLLG